MGLHRAHTASLICGFVLVAWITLQVYLIGYVSWLQPTMMLAGLIIILLSSWLIRIPAGKQKLHSNAY